EIFVTVPVAPWETVVRAAPNLDESHAALQQPPRDQAACAEVPGLYPVKPIKFSCRFAFAGEVENLGRAELEAGSKLVAGAARLEPGIALAGCRISLVQRLNQFQPIALGVRRDELRRVGWKQVEDGIRLAD